jgi:hypothetical protein
MSHKLTVINAQIRREWRRDSGAGKMFLIQGITSD